MGRLARTAFIALVAASPPLAAADLSGDAGWSPGFVDHERFRSSYSMPTFGVWGTVGIGGAYLEARALASDYRYLGADEGPNGEYPRYRSTVYVFELGLLYAPAIRLGSRVKLSPHIGGGWCAVDLKTRASLSPTQGGGESRDKSPGHYVHAGASLLFLKDRLRAGFDFQRIRGTRVTMFGAQETADHDQATFLIGYHWGGAP